MSQEPSSKLSSPASSEQLEPKYKGVRKRKWGKWVSEIRLPNSRDRIWLGSFDSPEKAARAFDAAQFCLRGPSATFNFPDSPPNIVNGQSLSPQQIQVVAARYANEHPIPTTSFLSTQGQQHCTDTSSSSAPSDRTVQAIDSNVDAKINDNASYIDWSFLNLLDNNDGVSDFCFFHSNELYPEYMTLAEAPENNQDNHDEDEHSTLKLWNF